MSHLRMPAEWEPHEATWLAWPHREDDWPGKFAAIPWVFAEMIRHLLASEPVYLVVQDAAREAEARTVLGQVLPDAVLDGVRFFHCPTDRGWMRDTGPLVVRDETTRRVVDFAFNAWAKYPEYALDNQIALSLADALEMSVIAPEMDGRRLVLEGGAVDVNGRGALLATEECLLDAVTQVRNPEMSAETLEDGLRRYLGASTVLWLGRGIAGDDTHGHVDDVCRFVDETRIVLCRSPADDSENYAALEENRERLTDARLADGTRPVVIDLPMPSPLYFDGVRLPASYANFYIANERVLVPTFNDPQDRVALGVLQDCFTDRTVVGIHAVDLVWGLGTIHCLTQQLPAG